MRGRTYFFIIAGLVLLLGLYFVFSTVPQTTPGNSAQPPVTANPGERLSGERIDGQIVFSRQGALWAWKGDSASRLPLDPGSSVIAKQNVSLTQPALAPGGASLAFVHQDETFSDLWLAGADGKNPRSFSNNKGKGQPRSDNYNATSLWAFAPAWSPDGSQLAYLSDVQTDDLALWLTPAKTFQPKRLSALAVGQGGLERPAWSPDGTQIAVAAFENGKPQIYIIKVSNGKETRLTETEEGALDPAWSPDGKYISFVVRKGNSSFLWLMHTDGSGTVQLVNGITARNPAWSPDGSKLAFLGLRGTGFEIFTVAPNATGTGAAGDARQISRDAGISAVGGLTWAN